jgi:hypothetical protein
MHRFHENKVYVWMENSSSRFFITTYAAGKRPRITLYICRTHGYDEEATFEITKVSEMLDVSYLNNKILVAQSKGDTPLEGVGTFIAKYRSVLRRRNGGIRQQFVRFDPQSKLRDKYIVNCNDIGSVVLNFNPDGSRKHNVGGMLE